MGLSQETIVQVAITAGNLIFFGSMTYFMTKQNKKDLKEIKKILGPMPVDIVAIKMQVMQALELRAEVKEDHDNTVRLIDKAEGMQKGLNSVRKDLKEHVVLFHSKQ